MARTRLIALWLISLALLAGACPVVLAQGTDTVYDEAGVLTGSQEQNVQGAFDSAREKAGQPIYAFLVPDTGVSSTQDRQELLTREAREADVPPDAGVLLGGLFVLVAGAAALIHLRNRRARRRRVEQERGRAEEEFAGLATRLDEFDRKQRLVSGYLEAQRPLLDQKTEEWVEGRLSEASTAGFAQEFNEAASVLTSDPFRARELMGRGRDLLAGAIENLNEAERTMDAYRAAEEALDHRLLAAEEEIQAAERAGQTARSEGVAVEPPQLRPKYDRLARSIGDRSSHREEFDPTETLAALEE